MSSTRLVGYCVALVLMGSTLALAQPQLPFEAVITADQVNIRSGPHLNYYHVQRLDAGEIVRVVDVTVSGEISWYHIEPPAGSYSNVHADFVRLAARGQTGEVIGNRVRVRAPSPAGPDVSKSYKVQAYLNRGDTVKVLGQNGPWLQIAPPKGVVLFVTSEFLREANPADIAAAREKAAALVEAEADPRPAEELAARTTADAPATPETAETPETVETAEIAGTPDLPETIETPEAVEVAEVTEAEASAEVTEASPEAATIDEVVETVEVAEVVEVAEAETEAETPEVVVVEQPVSEPVIAARPESAAPAEAVAESTTPAKPIVRVSTPTAPQSGIQLNPLTPPASPAIQETPETPETTDTPATPEVVVTPVAPVAPETPEAPIAPEAPAVVETPASPAQPELTADPAEAADADIFASEPEPAVAEHVLSNAGDDVREIPVEPVAEAPALTIEPIAAEPAAPPAPPASPITPDAPSAPEVAETTETPIAPATPVVPEIAEVSQPESQPELIEQAEPELIESVEVIAMETETGPTTEEVAPPAPPETPEIIEVARAGSEGPLEQTRPRVVMEKGGPVEIIEPQEAEPLIVDEAIVVEPIASGEPSLIESVESDSADASEAPTRVRIIIEPAAEAVEAEQPIEAVDAATTTEPEQAGEADDLDPETRQIIETARAEVAANQSRLEALESELARARADLAARRVASAQAEADQPRDYDAVGQLVASAIYTGYRLPRLYRIVDPHTSLTIAYLRPSDQVNLNPMLGRFVGINGSRTYDAALKLHIITPSEAVLLVPADSTPVDATR